MDEIAIKDQLAALVKEIRARTAKIEVISATLERVTAKLDCVTVKPATALDASSPTTTTSMVSRVEVHDAVPPSSGPSSVTTHTAELVSELPARCATPANVHDIWCIGDAATPLCTLGVSAPTMCASPAPAHRPVAALELDKRTPTRCSMLGLGPVAFDDKSMGIDNFGDKSMSVPVALEPALLAGLRMPIAPKADALAPTVCSTKCSSINVDDTSSAKLHTFVSTEHHNVLALRPVPWPSFSEDTIRFQLGPPWPSFKVASGGKFSSRTDPGVIPSATQLLKFLGNLSSCPNRMFVNKLCNPCMGKFWDEVHLRFKEVWSDIQWVRQCNISLYAPSRLVHHVSGIDQPVSARSSDLSWFACGKQLQCLWGAEHLLGEKYGAGSTNIFQGVGFVIGRGDVDLQYTPGLQSLSDDLLWFRMAEWKGNNQVADNCKRSSQNWYHTVQSARIHFPYLPSIVHIIQSTTHVLVGRRRKCLNKTQCIFVGLSPLGNLDRCIPTRGDGNGILSPSTKSVTDWTSAIPWKISSNHSHLTSSTAFSTHVPRRMTCQTMSIVQPSGEPLRHPLDAIFTVKWHGTSLIENNLVRLQYKACMRDENNMFTVAPMIEPGLSRLLCNLLLEVMLGRGRLICSPKHGLFLPWHGHLSHLSSWIHVDYAESIPKMIGRVATRRQHESGLDHGWSLLNMSERPEHHRDSMNILGHKLRPEGATLVSWLTPIPVHQKFEVIASSYVLFIGKHLRAPWDPGGGILQVFADCGLRASRMLRRGECHVPTVTWPHELTGPWAGRWIRPAVATLRSCRLDSPGYIRVETTHGIDMDELIPETALLFLPAVLSYLPRLSP